MRIRKLVIVALVALCGAGAIAQPAAAVRLPGSVHGGVSLAASLAGPVRGQTGTALVTVNSGQRQVCYRVTVHNLRSVTAAHIHKGGPSDNGPIVVPLFELTTPMTGTVLTFHACVHATTAVLTAIVRHPAGYYVNVHTTAKPAGAIRGQLHRAE